MANTLSPKIVRAIIDGKFDEDLERLTRAIKQRRESLVAAFYAELEVGDRIRLVHVKPKYLAGSTGIVTGFSGDRVIIDLDSAITSGRKRWSTGIRVYPSSLERADG